MTVDLAWKTLLHDKLRFLITVCGVAFAVSLVFFQNGLFQGILGHASVTIERARADIWVTPRNTPNVDFAQLFPRGAVHKVRSVPGVQRADALVVFFLNMTLPSGATEMVLVYAMEDFRPWGIPWNVPEGRIEELRSGPFFLLDDSASKRLGPFAAGEFREIQGRRLRIVGRTREAMSFTTTPMVFMGLATVESLLPDMIRGMTSYVLVKLETGADPSLVKAEIARMLPYNDVLSRGDWAARSKSYWVDSTGIGFNLWFTVFLGALVGVVIVAQTLYSSTMEHLKEFGTLKAIGGTNADIYRILARQAAIAAVVGFVLGAIPPFASIPLVEAAGLKLLLTPAFCGGVFLATMLLCLSASAISFRKIARLDPAMVFRQ